MELNIVDLNVFIQYLQTFFLNFCHVFTFLNVFVFFECFSRLWVISQALCSSDCDCNVLV